VERSHDRQRNRRQGGRDAHPGRRRSPEGPLPAPSRTFLPWEPPGPVRCCSRAAARAAETRTAATRGLESPGSPPPTEKRARSRRSLTTTTSTSSARTRTRRATPRSCRTRPWTVKVEGECVSPHLRDRRAAQAPRRGAVYGCAAWKRVDVIRGTASARHAAREGPAHLACEVRRFRKAPCSRKNMPGVGAFGASPFPYLEGLRIRRATLRSRCSPSASTARSCPSRTVPPSLVVPGSTGSNGQVVVRIRLQETQPHHLVAYGGGTSTASTRT